MPLHDWTDRSGWEGLHLFWMTEIARFLRSELPTGYRAVIGSSPLVAVGMASGNPDVAVAHESHQSSPASSVARSNPEPDLEVAVATLEIETNLQVEREGRLVAAIELVSPRNKDRPSAREQYASRYLSYLSSGVHLLLVDVHRRPLAFSFAGLIGESLGGNLPSLPAPAAISYRVGAPAATGGRMLGVWQHELIAGQPLPPIPLALTQDLAVMVELESTYSRAAADSYIS
jgi:hypothetical protein